jgi:hypothetical protein
MDPNTTQVADPGGRSFDPRELGQRDRVRHLVTSYRSGAECTRSWLLEPGQQ